ncbi:DUF1292 domain-containing protein [Crassaminicella indica]|uniref:DUF1292 domain-containing protein n=1 Tax=Crassaminicella indica TaxID=2855394 RepID=A0ABX8RBZ7_9CLOT|nr:DUF1292 domain-containing protein [Crassaminicella indica]QXM05979.1 DUF1292 domain-containing protein [Crassaminicella indica]
MLKNNEEVVRMENENIITLLDDSGKEIDFEIVATLKIEDIEYAILSPVDENDEGVVIFKIIDSEGKEVLENVQDEKELNQVISAYEELFKEE